MVPHRRVHRHREHPGTVVQPAGVQRHPQRGPGALGDEFVGDRVGAGPLAGDGGDLRVVGVGRRDLFDRLATAVPQVDPAGRVEDRCQAGEVQREHPGVAGLRRVQDDGLLDARGDRGHRQVGVRQDRAVRDGRPRDRALDLRRALQPVRQAVRGVDAERGERGVRGLCGEVDSEVVGALVPAAVTALADLGVHLLPGAGRVLVVDLALGDLPAERAVGVVEVVGGGIRLGRVALARRLLEPLDAAARTGLDVAGEGLGLVELALALARLAARAAARPGPVGGHGVAAPRRRARLLLRHRTPRRVVTAEPGQQVVERPEREGRQRLTVRHGLRGRQHQAQSRDRDQRERSQQTTAQCPPTAGRAGRAHGHGEPQSRSASGPAHHIGCLTCRQDVSGNLCPIGGRSLLLLP